MPSKCFIWPFCPCIYLLCFLAESCSVVAMRDACSSNAWWFSTRRLWRRAMLWRCCSCCSPWSLVARRTFSISAWTLATSLFSCTSWFRIFTISLYQPLLSRSSWISWASECFSSSSPQHGEDGDTSGGVLLVSGAEFLSKRLIVISYGLTSSSFAKGSTHIAGFKISPQTSYIAVCQGSSKPTLPAEFNSSPNQRHLRNIIRVFRVTGNHGLS